jgi:hypothetical protein
MLTLMNTYAMSPLRFMFHIVLLDTLCCVYGNIPMSVYILITLGNNIQACCSGAVYLSLGLRIMNARTSLQLSYKRSTVGLVVSVSCLVK